MNKPFTLHISSPLPVLYALLLQRTIIVHLPIYFVFVILHFVQYNHICTKWSIFTCMKDFFKVLIIFLLGTVRRQILRRNQICQRL